MTISEETKFGEEKIEALASSRNRSLNNFDAITDTHTVHI